MSALHRYPDEVIEYIRANAPAYCIAKMVDVANDHFKGRFVFTYGKRLSLYKNHHIHAQPRAGRKYPERKITTPEIEAFIAEHYKGTGPTRMAELVNAQFGTSYTAGQINAYYCRNHLISGLTGRFEKGMTPANKGKKWDDFMPPASQEGCRRTQFKPGNRPQKQKPVGYLSRRTDKTGRVYCYRKVAEPNVWKMEHVLVWEAHNGPAPRGYVITFINGDSTDCRIENLMLITRSQHAILNRAGLRHYDRQSMEAALNIAAVAQASAAAKRRRKKNRS